MAREGERWIEQPPPSPSDLSTYEPRLPRPEVPLPERMTRPSGPASEQSRHWQEFSQGYMRFGVGGRARAGTGYPQVTGLIAFTPAGVFLTLPWSADEGWLPGLRRDPRSRTTTLIVQTDERRVEVEIAKEVMEGGWTPVPLASPASSSQPTSP